MGKLYETETWPEGSSGNATRAKYGRRTKWRIRLAGEKLNVLWQSAKEGGGEEGLAYSVFLMVAARHLSAAREKSQAVFDIYIEWFFVGNLLFTAK